VEACGVWRRLGVLAGEFLHQGTKLGGAGFDFHGVGYVHYFDRVWDVLLLGFGFLCGGALLHAAGAHGGVHGTVSY